MNEEINCPVDHVLVNENKTRVIAFFILALTLLFIGTGSLYIVLFMLLDFSLRAFNFNRYSIIALMADGLIQLFKIKNKPVDRAPKRFAAGVGLAFTVLIAISVLLNWHAGTLLLAGVLAVFACLEAFFGFCAGCHVYTLLQKFS